MEKYSQKPNISYELCEDFDILAPVFVQNPGSKRPEKAYIVFDIWNENIFAASQADLSDRSFMDSVVFKFEIIANASYHQINDLLTNDMFMEAATTVVADYFSSRFLDVDSIELMQYLCYNLITSDKSVMISDAKDYIDIFWEDRLIESGGCLDGFAEAITKEAAESNTVLIGIDEALDEYLTKNKV